MPDRMTPTWRLLLSGPGDAAWNMAVDEILLGTGASRPTLRLYGWEPPAVSLGRFQRTLPPRIPRGTPVVRRPTGGGAIYHFREVTFALACSTHIPPLAGGRMTAYDRVNEAIATALDRLGVQAHLWQGRAIASDGLCFDARSPSDLIHAGRKIAGSAQRRRGDRLLLHGVLPLDPNPLAASSTSLREATGREVTVAEAEGLLVESFAERLGIRLAEAGLTPEEAAAAAERRDRIRKLAAPSRPGRDPVRAPVRPGG